MVRALPSACARTLQEGQNQAFPLRGRDAKGTAIIRKKLGAIPGCILRRTAKSQLYDELSTACACEFQITARAHRMPEERASTTRPPGGAWEGSSMCMGLPSRHTRLYFFTAARACALFRYTTSACSSDRPLRHHKKPRRSRTPLPRPRPRRCRRQSQPDAQPKLKTS